MTQSTESNAIWLTKDAFEGVRAELERLKGPVRQEIVARISAARDEGDLSENGGYHAARDDQGKNEGKIRNLEAVLEHADTTPADDDGTVTVGKVVTYKFDGDDDDEAETVLIGARENEDYIDGLSPLSPQAPLGAALLGAQAGSVVEYEGPTGRKNKVEVLSAAPYPA